MSEVGDTRGAHVSGNASGRAEVVVVTGAGDIVGHYAAWASARFARRAGLAIATEVVL